MLNITSYVSEVEQDIDFAKQWLRTHTRFQPILFIQWGGSLGIHPNTYLDRNLEKLGIIKFDRLFSCLNRPPTRSTPQVRAQWVHELNTVSRELGYRVCDNIDNHFLLETLIDA